MRADPAARSFAERLLALTERIEREFSGDQQERLLALARETFERHLALRREAARLRASLAALRADRKRLRELLEFLSRGRGDDPVH